MALRGAFQAFANAAGLEGYRLPDMTEIARLAAPHYNNHLRGGEGHMEVGKLIYNVLHRKVTMTLSVKPFGCMPSSSVSDGVQSRVTEKYPGSLFCAVETSGDGAVSFQSRVQMFLFKSKQLAQAEFEQALRQRQLNQQQFVERLRQSRFASPLAYPSHHGTTSAVNLLGSLTSGQPHLKSLAVTRFGRLFRPLLAAMNP